MCAFFDFSGAESLWKAPGVSDRDRVRERPHAVEEGSMPTIERDDSAVYTANDDDQESELRGSGRHVVARPTLAR